MSSDSSSGSSSSSVISEVLFPTDMTEEEALAIWLRRDSELEERRLQRERAAAAAAAEAAASPPVVMLMNYPPNEYSALAYQRYIDNSRPGLADAYVASSPGLALLLEQRRQELARQRREEILEQQSMELLVRQQLQAERLAQERHEAHLYEQAQRRQDVLVGSHINILLQNQSTVVSSIHGSVMDNGSISSGSNYSSIADSQAREYERLSQAHSQILSDEDMARSMSSESSPENSGVAPPPRPAEDPDNSQGNNDDDSKNKEKTRNRQDEYYLATVFRTTWNTKRVACQHCDLDLYTNPLANQFFCQNCCEITGVEHQDMDTRCEEKMQDVDDYDVEMAY